MNPSTDYYILLGVNRDAAPDEIKAAFKRQALKYHPDVYKGEDAHERMRLLLHAYQVLNDPQARRDYDAGLTPRSPAGRKQENSAPQKTKTRQGGRNFDFPTFHDGQPLRVDLDAMTYTLTPNEARTLAHQGLLRGVAPETEQHHYYCHRCHHNWQPGKNAAQAERWDVPRYCPRCEADDWPEYLLLRCSHCHAIFESEQIRYAVSGYHYSQKQDQAALCPPYELFPLCPNCRRSRWCPAEEARVQELRRRTEQREAMLRLVWIGVAVVLIVAAGAFILSSGFH